jgi:hypothetical protein
LAADVDGLDWRLRRGVCVDVPEVDGVDCVLGVGELGVVEVLPDVVCAPSIAVHPNTSAITAPIPAFLIHASVPGVVLAPTRRAGRTPLRQLGTAGAIQATT